MTMDLTGLAGLRAEWYALLGRDTAVAAARRGIRWIPRGASTDLVIELVRDACHSPRPDGEGYCDVLAWRQARGDQPAGWWLIQTATGHASYVGDRDEDGEALCRTRT